MAEFKRLAEVDTIKTVNDEDTVLVVQGDEVKQIPSNELHKPIVFYWGEECEFEEGTDFWGSYLYKDAEFTEIATYDEFKSAVLNMRAYLAYPYDDGGYTGVDINTLYCVDLCDTTRVGYDFLMDFNMFFSDTDITPLLEMASSASTYSLRDNGEKPTIAEILSAMRENRRGSRA